MKRIMGIDYGDARTGVAFSDLLCSIVGTTTVIHSRRPEKTLAEIVKLVGEHEVGEIVMGLPKNMDGSEGPRADVIKAFVAILSELTELPIDLADERMTTMEAYRFLDGSGTYGKKRKGVIDTLSAQIILQDYLDRERASRR